MGLRAEIFTHAMFAKCSNGGLSGRVTAVTIVNASGPFDPDDNAPAVLLDGEKGGSVRAVPAIRDATGKWVPLRKSGVIGPMMGGAYVATSDSRFGDAIRRIIGAPFYGAVAFHDRFETTEQYAILSR